MNAIVEIDKAGRIVVPKKFRDALHLVPGTRLKIEQYGDRMIFEPDFPEPEMILKDGMWVIMGGTPITTAEVNAVIQQGYDERQERIMEGSGLE
jgi:AbrB family looped-hinge helix DNA binding protein